MRVLVVAALALSLPACGTPARVLVDETPTDSPTVSALPSLPTLLPSAQPTPSRTPAPGKKVYSDSPYGYSLEYPADFLTDEGPGPTSRTGWLKTLRFYDPKYEGKEPEGQVQVWIFARDAEDLTTWLNKHTLPSSGPDSPLGYFQNVGDVASTQLAQRQAISFVTRALGSPTLYTMAVFVGEYVLTVAYFGYGGYEATIKALYEDVVASVHVSSS